MGFDGSSITGFNAIEESDMIAMPDPTTFRAAAVAPGGRRRRRRAHVRRRPDARARALRGRPAPRPAPRRGAREGDGLRALLRRARSSSTSCSATTSGTEVLDEGGYFDLTTLDAGSDVRRETVLALEKLGIGVEYSHHEVGPSPARDRHALRRRAEDGRRLHDVPHHGQGVRDEVRLARDVHAQAAVRRERLGHAHAPVAVQGRRATRSTTPTTSTSCPTSARRSSPASCATRARSARSSPSG